MATRRLEDMAAHCRTKADAEAPEFWVATLETRHFSFEAYGLTKPSCRDAMRRAITVHVIQHYRCDGALRQENIECLMDDVEPQKRAMGEGYRDHECLTGGK